MSLFKLHAPFQPAGSQPEAIAKLKKGRPGRSTLIGVTGSGKTYTMANVIAQQNKPVLVLAPNKTLAAQLYEEFSLFFPENKVCYFVSYYDYYQPESYLPAQDIYIPKETKINTEIERLRVETTASLINRPDTIVIASVSAIYSLGNPNDYRDLAFSLQVGQEISRSDLLRKLIFIQYKRNDVAKDSGTFQVLGNTIEVNLPYQKEKLRIELFGNTIESLQWVSKQNNHVLMNLDNTLVFPAKHFVTTQESKDAAIKSIQAELEEYAPTITNPMYRERLEKRIAHDIEMIQETGHCAGIENYSSHFDGRATGEAPFCLFDFFPKDFLLIIDESHIALPQLRGMYAGDRVRKKALIDFGFRLPSAYDNRPLQFEEIEKYFNDVVFVSATPGDYELRNSDTTVEQLIRPTGLLDPQIEVHGRVGQIDHLVEQIKATSANGYRTLVTVLTKKLAEELAEYLEEQKIKVCYLHSDLKTPQRTELLQKLRLGIFDCLVGVNLLREGLDLPEVAFVAVMDADVESFLRDKRSLIQIVGRAARNMDSKVVFYADKMTQSMRAAIDETNRRRKLQQDYNKKHNITPVSVKREVTKSISNMQALIAQASKSKKKKKEEQALSGDAIVVRITMLEKQMQDAAERLDFETAIALRSEWQELKKQQ
ncbi:MAG TPA: excinuclease ABC subunit UvrB [Candidatus Dependentiae bacterium]|nr:excinuclease ABC subunit UvrB [Candidatus Dependentiae bacterium]HRQ63164.1 excinuclease ABC subunit UvrB [Candidatus Dependentiae bacterium]